MAPFQIKSQALRQAQLGPGAAPDVFEARADREESPSGGKGRWRQADVKRAIAAAEQAGLASYRIEIAPDGAIAIVVGDPADTADPARGRNPYGNLLGA
jgi:hypothetical protein